VIDSLQKIQILEVVKIIADHAEKLAEVENENCEKRAWMLERIEQVTEENEGNSEREPRDLVVIRRIQGVFKGPRLYVGWESRKPKKTPDKIIWGG
jgi:hypothetical protein